MINRTTGEPILPARTADQYLATADQYLARYWSAVNIWPDIGPLRTYLARYWSTADQYLAVRFIMGLGLGLD
jgi:hypothetical protein